MLYKRISFICLVSHKSLSIFNLGIIVFWTGTQWFWTKTCNKITALSLTITSIEVIQSLLKKSIPPIVWISYWMKKKWKPVLLQNVYNNNQWKASKWTLLWRDSSTYNGLDKTLHLKFLLIQNHPCKLPALGKKRHVLATIFFTVLTSSPLGSVLM